MRSALAVLLVGCVIPAKHAPDDDGASDAAASPDAVGIDARACSPTVAGNGARGLFHFDEPSGQTLDNAVGGRDAVLGDDGSAAVNDPARMSPARFSAGLHFTASDSDLVRWPADLGDVGEHTLELWVRPSSSGTLLITLDSTISLSLSPDLAVVYTVTDRGGDRTATVTSTPITADTWHHVLASYKKPNVRLWVDAVAAPAEQVDAGFRADAFDLGVALTADLDELYVAESAITEDAVARSRYCPP
jgi:hypothetical protein